MGATTKIKSGTSTEHHSLRDVAKHEKKIQGENPLPIGINEKTYTLDDAFEPLWNKLSEFYGTDLRNL
jgi:hypothetical protein